MKTLKAILMTIVTVAATTSFAEVRSEIKQLSSVKLENNGKLTYSYYIGGGCAEHKPDVSVKLIKGKYGVELVEVIVTDVSSSQDLCEANLLMKGEADLIALTKQEAAKDKSIDLGNYFTFKLPLVSQFE